MKEPINPLREESAVWKALEGKTIRYALISAEVEVGGKPTTGDPYLFIGFKGGGQLLVKPAGGTNLSISMGSKEIDASKDDIDRVEESNWKYDYKVGEWKKP